MTAEAMPKAANNQPKPPRPTIGANGTEAKAAPGPAPNESPKPRSEPQQALPTDRITFLNQLKLLRAYAAASNGGTKRVSNEDVAAVVEMKASTVSLANSFFVKNGFLIRSGREYTPTKEVLEYKLAHEWDESTAALKLGPLVERTWFAQALKPKLDLRPMEESEALSDLAQRASAGPEYRNQIKTLIDYMVTSGMVSREGTILSLVRRRPGEAPSLPLAEDEKPAPPPVKPPADEPSADLATLPFGQVGTIKFAVTINVDITQMSQWEPQRLAAFFTGLAQVISAQKGGRQV